MKTRQADGGKKKRIPQSFHKVDCPKDWSTHKIKLQSEGETECPLTEVKRVFCISVSEHTNRVKNLQVPEEVTQKNQHRDLLCTNSRTARNSL